MSQALAIDGGSPIRQAMLPYGRQCLEDDDIQAVVAVLRSDWLTTGPKVSELEEALSAAVGAAEGVVVSNGTAALHAAMFAVGIGPGDEVIVPPMTFAATANCAVYQGGRPVFADVDAETLLLDPECVESKITPRTRAIIAVDYAGHPCDYAVLRSIADSHGLTLVADGCHALGGEVDGQPVGSLAELTAFSFHPVKHVAAGEGGAVTTDRPEMVQRMRVFRNHGITTDHRERAKHDSWLYEMVDLGYNYRLTDFQCALALTQLRKLPQSVARRREIAGRYDAAFGDLPALVPLAARGKVVHAYHLYVVQLDLARLRVDRGAVFRALRAEGIGVNVHYVPVHLHPYYRERLGTKPGDCPVAEAAYERILSLPMFPSMSDSDIDDVVQAVRKVVSAYPS